MDSMLPQLWGRGDIPGAPLLATEVSSPGTPKGAWGEAAWPAAWCCFSSGLTFDVHRLLFPLASTGQRTSDKSLAMVSWSAGEGLSESQDCFPSFATEERDPLSSEACAMEAGKSTWQGAKSPCLQRDLGLSLASAISKLCDLGQDI